MAVLDEADCTTHLDCNKNRHLSSRRAGWEEEIEEREGGRWSRGAPFSWFSRARDAD